MITDGKQSDEIDKWHYITFKSVPTDNGVNRPIRSLSRLFIGITSNNNGDFYCLAVFIHFELIMRLKVTKDYVITMIIAMQKCLIMIITH